MFVVLKKAVATYAKQKKNENYVNVANLALKNLNEDAGFSSCSDKVHN